MTKRMAYLALLAAGVLPGGAAQRAVIVIKVDKGQNDGRRSVQPASQIPLKSKTTSARALAA
jgi:hypothetical protein